MRKATPEEFIEAWQRSASTKEAAEKLNMTTKQASSRAGFYRRQGIPLKLFRGKTIAQDLERLKKLAHSLKDKNGRK